MAVRNSIGAVSGNEPAHQSIPLLRSSEEQLAKIRRQLERMFGELRLVQDVIMVCGDVRESTGSDLDSEVEHVLRRCGSDRLFSVLKVLTEIVERFCGKTEMSEARQDGKFVCSPNHQPRIGPRAPTNYRGLFGAVETARK